MRPEFVILSRAAVERYEPSGTEVCVSITNPGDPPARLSSTFTEVLRLSFTDVTSMRLQKQTDVLFDAAHAQAILAFVDRWRTAERIVVHCEMGRSRSSGVALALCEVLARPVDHIEAQFPEWNRLVRATLLQAHSRRRP